MSSTKATPVDLTGRDRIAWNVITSWAGHVVFVISGFALPRAIDAFVGQTMLGVWDFAWSLVNYFKVAMIGAPSALNTYIARYRVEGNFDAMSRVVSSVQVFAAAVCILTTLAIAAIAALVPQILEDSLQQEVSTARWVIVALGLSLVFQFAFQPYRGTLAGLHRWDIHNGIDAAFFGGTLFLMIMMLRHGFDLVAIAAVYAVGTLLAEIGRMVAVFRLCPQLRVSPRLFDLEELKKTILFGAKTVLNALPPLVVSQTTFVLIAGMLGPNALAVFARPVALIRHISTFIDKFSYVLTPTAGSLGRDSGDEIRRFLLEAARYGLALSLPMVVVLMIFGDHIIALWMGPEYVHHGVIVALCIGFILPLSQTSVLRVLVGLDMHGRVALITLPLVLIAFAIGVGYLHLTGWSLLKAAIVLGVSLSVPGVVVPLQACSHLQIPLSRFLWHVLPTNLACAVLYGSAMWGIRTFLPASPIVQSAVALGVGFSLIAWLYWAFVLPASIKDKVLKRRRGRG